jgi:preprotein translocase subunit SecG
MLNKIKSVLIFLFFGIILSASVSENYKKNQKNILHKMK